MEQNTSILNLCNFNDLYKKIVVLQIFLSLKVSSFSSFLSAEILFLLFFFCLLMDLLVIVKGNKRKT